MSTNQKTLQQLLTERVEAYSASDRPRELIDAGIDSLFKDIVKDAFQSYGDFGKAIKTAVKEALPANVSDMFELTRYNALIAGALKTRWEEAAISETMLAKANAAITEVLEEAPLEGEISLRALLEAFAEEHKEEAAEERWERPEIRFEDGSTETTEFIHIYFDKHPKDSGSDAYSRRKRENYQMANALHVMVESKRESPNHWSGPTSIGRVYSAKIDDAKIGTSLNLRSKWEKLIAALYFGNATLVIDCDDGDISYGLYD